MKLVLCFTVVISQHCRVPAVYDIHVCLAVTFAGLQLFSIRDER